MRASDSLNLLALRETGRLSQRRPDKSLSRGISYSAGRSASGRITMRHRGGRGRRMFRQIDFKRKSVGIQFVVDGFEYDPNRSALVAHLQAENGKSAYVLLPNDVEIGDVLSSGIDAEISPGNFMPISRIPVGYSIHAIETRPGKGGTVARSAGVSAKLIGRDCGVMLIRMKSGRYLPLKGECGAVIGSVANADHLNKKDYKAGCSRWRGIRPSVRGVAMNPVDHPMGGGEGKSSGGRHPVSPWGWQTKGYKTVRGKKKNGKNAY